MAARGARSAACSLGPKPLQLTQSLEVAVDLREIHLASGAACSAARGLGCVAGDTWPGGTLQSQVVRDTLDELVAEQLLAGEESLEEGVVADAVDDARSSPRALVDGQQGLGGEGHARGAGQPQAVLDVGLGGLGGEGLELVAQRHALGERRVQLEVLLDVRQAEEHEGDELAL